MIKAEIKNNLKVPKIFFKEDLKYVAERIIVPIMQENIENQVALNGSPLPPNDPKYTARKVKKGLSPKILIATGKLRRDFMIQDSGAYGVKIKIQSERSKIGGYMMDLGKVFFGISTRMEKNAIAYMKNRLKEILAGAKAG